MPGTVYLSEFLQSYNIDVIGLSEHWLFPHSIDFLHSIDCEFEYFGKCDSDLYTPIDGAMRQRGKGGVALLWHKRISKQVSHVQIDDDRIIAIDVILENNLHLIIICIYMPSSDNVLTNLENILTNYVICIYTFQL